MRRKLIQSAVSVVLLGFGLAEAQQLDKLPKVAFFRDELNRVSPTLIRSPVRFGKGYENSVTSKAKTFKLSTAMLEGNRTD
jgi:hypothetical protein